MQLNKKVEQLRMEQGIERLCSTMNGNKSYLFGLRPHKRKKKLAYFFYNNLYTLKRQCRFIDLNHSKESYEYNINYRPLAKSAAMYPEVVNMCIPVKKNELLKTYYSRVLRYLQLLDFNLHFGSQTKEEFLVELEKDNQIYIEIQPQYINIKFEGVDYTPIYVISKFMKGFLIYRDGLLHYITVDEYKQLHKEYRILNRMVSAKISEMNFKKVEESIEEQQKPNIVIVHLTLFKVDVSVFNLIYVLAIKKKYKKFKKLRFKLTEKQTIFMDYDRVLKEILDYQVSSLLENRKADLQLGQLERNGELTPENIDKIFREKWDKKK